MNKLRKEDTEAQLKRKAGESAVEMTDKLFEIFSGKTVRKLIVAAIGVLIILLVLIVSVKGVGNCNAVVVSANQIEVDQNDGSKKITYKAENENNRNRKYTVIETDFDKIEYIEKTISQTEGIIRLDRIHKHFITGSEFLYNLRYFITPCVSVLIWAALYMILSGVKWFLYHGNDVYYSEDEDLERLRWFVNVNWDLLEERIKALKKKLNLFKPDEE